MHKIKVTKREVKAISRNVMVCEILEGFHVVGNAARDTERWLSSVLITVGEREYMGLPSLITIDDQFKRTRKSGIPFVRVSL